MVNKYIPPQYKKCQENIRWNKLIKEINKTEEEMDRMDDDVWVRTLDSLAKIGLTVAIIGFTYILPSFFLTDWDKVPKREYYIGTKTGKTIQKFLEDKKLYFPYFTP